MKKLIKRVILDGIYLFGLWFIGWVNPFGRADLMEKWARITRRNPSEQ